MNKLKTTRDVILHTSQFVTGKTLDYGAGEAKYRYNIEPLTSKYITFDMIPGKNIDIVGDVLNSPFSDNEFDTVISTQVLEHISKPWVMVREIKRILKPGGMCIMTAPFMVPYHADPYDFFRYTKEGLASLFLNEEFEILENESYGKTFTVLAEMIHFVFFSHYKPRSEIKKIWIRRIMRVIKPTAYKLDVLVKNKVLYPNSYVVARKK